MEDKTEAGIQPASQKASLLVPASPVPRRRSWPHLDCRERWKVPAQAQICGSPSAILGGSMGARDASEAAKLLWKAVGKQNPTAAILLSGLYARGDGVTKSCDQARLLLLAATKHGSGAGRRGSCEILSSTAVSRGALEPDQPASIPEIVRNTTNPASQRGLFFLPGVFLADGSGSALRFVRALIH